MASGSPSSHGRAARGTGKPLFSKLLFAKNQLTVFCIQTLFSIPAY